MARPYSDEFLRFLAETNQRTLGIDLAKLCVKANIPASHVATALEASRMTVYAWFRGGDIRAKKRKTIEIFMNIVQQDLDTGTLPAKNVVEARSYIATITGVAP